MRRLTSSLPFAFGILLVPASALGQDAAADPETITQFARLVRWSGVLTSLILIAAAFVLLRFLRNFVAQLSEQFAARRLLFTKIETLVQFLVYVGTGIATVALSLRLDERVLAVIGGTVAVSVGFAIKDLVASFIAGIMIMIDRPFQVGDRVDFGGQYGDITAIGLRSVRMQTLDDNTVTIPNNKFLSEVTSCGNYGALDMQVGMQFFIGPDQDVDEALRIVREAAATSRFVHLPKAVKVLVKQVIQEQYVAVQIVLKAYVADTRFEKDFESDVSLRVLKAFRNAEISPPAVLHRGV